MLAGGQIHMQRQAVLVENELVRPRSVRSDLSVELETFVLRLMATEREHRPPTARAAIAIIEKLSCGEDFDIDEIYARHPYIPTISAEQVFEGADVDPTKQEGAKPALGPHGTKPLSPGDDESDEVLVAQLSQAQARADSVRNAHAPLTKQTKQLNIPQNLGQDGLDVSVLANSADARRGPPPSPFEKNAAKIGVDIARPKPTSTLKKYGLPAAVALIAVLATLTATGAFKRVRGETTQTIVTPHEISPADLEQKKDDTALAKFAPEQSANRGLAGLSPDIKAQYPGTLGELPPPPTESLSPSSTNGGGKHRRSAGLDGDGPRSDSKRDEFDRTMKPAGAAAERDAAPSDPRNMRLAIPHNSEGEVRLVDTLDTSSDEPVRAELLKAIIVGGKVMIPVGSIMWGKTTLRGQRAQARFDRVVFPSGEEHRIAAVAVTSDGRDGIEGGRFEFGDAPDNKTGEKILRAAGTMAADAVGAVIPGTDSLSRGTQQLTQDEIRDQATNKQDAARLKNRVIVQRKTPFSIKFQAS